MPAFVAPTSNNFRDCSVAIGAQRNQVAFYILLAKVRIVDVMYLKRPCLASVPARAAAVVVKFQTFLALGAPCCAAYVLRVTRSRAHLPPRRMARRIASSNAGPDWVKPTM